MPVAYSAAQKLIFQQVLRLLVTAGVDLPGDLETLSDEIGNITSALGGPDAYSQGTHSGLTFNLNAGRISLNGGAPVETAAGGIALTNNATNYVEVSSAGVVSKNTSAFTAGQSPLYVVTTLSGAITDVADKRSFLSLLSAGVVGASSIASSAVTGIKLANAREILQFGRQALAASATAALAFFGPNTEFVAPLPGYLMSLSGAFDGALVGGTCTLKPTINGVVVSQTGLNALFDGSNPQYKYQNVAYAAHAAYHYNAGDRLGITAVTSSLNPTTLNVAAALGLRSE